MYSNIMAYGGTEVWSGEEKPQSDVCVCVRQNRFIHTMGQGTDGKCVYVYACVCQQCISSLAENVRSSSKWLAAGGDSCFNSWADRINSNAPKSKSEEHLFCLAAAPSAQAGEEEPEVSGGRRGRARGILQPTRPALTEQEGERMRELWGCLNHLPTSG